MITSPSGVDAEVNSIFEAVLGRPATAKDDRQYAPLVRQGNMVAVYADPVRLQGIQDEVTWILSEQWSVVAVDSRAVKSRLIRRSLAYCRAELTGH